MKKKQLKMQATWMFKLNILIAVIHITAFAIYVTELDTYKEYKLACAWVYPLLLYNISRNISVNTGWVVTQATITFVCMILSTAEAESIAIMRGDCLRNTSEEGDNCAPSDRLFYSMIALMLCLEWWFCVSALMVLHHINNPATKQ